MKVTLVGLQRVNFVNAKGQTVNGNNVFVAFKDENVEGLKTEKLFLKEGIELPKEVKINDVIDVSFNMHGKVMEIHKA